jgi:hypothetical protein
MNDVASPQAPALAGTPAEAVIADIWKRRLLWSAAADSQKRAIDLARAVALILSALGAILATAAATVLANEPEFRTPCAAAGAILLAVATYVTAQFVTPGALRSWTRARAVSEALKAEIFTFRAGVAPYGGADATDKLLDKIQAIQGPAADLDASLVEIQPKSAAPPPALDRSQYIAHRVQDQIDYYSKHARLYAQRQRWFRAIEFLMGLVATGLSGLATWFSSQGASGHSTLAAWVAVFTTLSSAVASHLAANRYAFLVMSYEATAQRLQDILTRWHSHQSPTDDDWSQFVKSSEDAISIENQGWMAKWAEKSGTGGK